MHEKVKPFRPIFKSYELSTYLSTRADQLGLKTLEIPVTRAYPDGKKYSTSRKNKRKLFVNKKSNGRQIRNV